MEGRFESEGSEWGFFAERLFTHRTVTPGARYDLSQRHKDYALLSDSSWWSAVPA